MFLWLKTLHLKNQFNSSNQWEYNNKIPAADIRPQILSILTDLARELHEIIHLLIRKEAVWVKANRLYSLHLPNIPQLENLNNSW